MVIVWLREYVTVAYIRHCRASAQDAVWVNGGTAACHTAGDVCLMLKASDKVTNHAINFYCAVSCSVPRSLLSFDLRVVLLLPDISYGRDITGEWRRHACSLAGSGQVGELVPFDGVPLFCEEQEASR